MMIFMRHPQHGEMHVYTIAEAEANEKNGWVRVAELKPEFPQNVEPMRKQTITLKGRG